jgi:hypothetical protein
VHAKMIFSKTLCVFINSSLNELFVGFINECVYLMDFSKMLVYDLWSNSNNEDYKYVLHDSLLKFGFIKVWNSFE